MWLVLLYGSDIDEQGLELLEEKQQQGGTLSGWPEKARRKILHFYFKTLRFRLLKYTFLPRKQKKENLSNFQSCL